MDCLHSTTSFNAHVILHQQSRSETAGSLYHLNWTQFGPSLAEALVTIPHLTCAAHYPWGLLTRISARYSRKLPFGEGQGSSYLVLVPWESPAGSTALNPTTLALRYAGLRLSLSVSRGISAHH